mgnify:CR=1 FL=1
MGKRSAFLGLGRLAAARPWPIFLVFLGLVGVSLYYLREFPMRTSYLDLLPAGDPVVAKYEAVQAELTGLDVAAILLSLGEPPPDPAERARLLFSVAERIIAELDPSLIVRASYHLRPETPLPPELLVFRTLYPAERERLAALAGELLALVPKLMDQAPPVLPAELPTDPTELDRVLGRVVEVGRASLAIFAELPRLRALVEEASALLALAQSRTVPEEQGQPLLSLDHTKLLIQVWPAQPAYASQAFNRAVRDELRRAVRAAKPEGLGVEAAFAGMYVVSTEVEDIIRRDMVVVTIISSVAVLLLTVLVLGNPGLAVLALVLVGISAVLIVAWAKFSVHGFNLLTTFLPALVLGLGIEYSLHLFSRFSEARQEGLGLEEAILLAVRTKGAASFVAALTTAAVFSCLLFSRSRALWELGAIMSLGMLLSFTTVFLLGPALLSLVGKFFPHLRGYPLLPRARLHHPYRNLLLLRWGVLLFSCLLTALALAKAVQVEFRFASAELAPTTSGQKVLAQIIQEFGGELGFGETFWVFVPEARGLGELSERLKAHPLVHSVLSARALLPAELLGQAVQLQALPLDHAQEGLRILTQVLEGWPLLLKEVEETAALFSLAELQSLLRAEIRRAQVFSRRATDFFRLGEELRGLDPRPLLEAVAAITQDLRLLQDFAAKLRGLPPEEQLIDQILALLPQEIRAQYKISRGYIVGIRVRPELYQGQNLQEFLAWLRGLGLDYVGSPELQLTLEEHMRRDFFLTTGVAVLFIFLVVLSDFRRPGRTLVALAPLGMGYVGMLGGMAALGLRFNFTNIVISPLLLGLGVDGAVHFLHRWEEEKAHGREAAVWAAAATAGPTLGSYLTTMASFGALLAAQTPGLRFLGASALLGLGFTALWTVLFLPAAVGELRKAQRGTKVA